MLVRGARLGCCMLADGALPEGRISVVGPAAQGKGVFQHPLRVLISAWAPALIWASCSDAYNDGRHPGSQRVQWCLQHMC